LAEARLGGVPKGAPLLDAGKAKLFPNREMCIVLQLPPRGVNDATGFMLAAGIACACAVARFAPAGVALETVALARLCRTLRPSVPVASQSGTPSQ
jgi:hypothetical protein